MPSPEADGPISTEDWLLGELDIKPLDKELWPAFAEFFARNGTVKSCWCMWWRASGSEFDRLGAEGKRRELQKRVGGASAPGLVALYQGEPIGWCSLGPREEFTRLSRSPSLKPIDDLPVWSVVCFFVDPAYRNRGVAEALLAAATVYAREHGVTTLEAYPVDSGPHRADDGAAFTGPLPLYMRGAGFREVARRKPNRPIVRLDIGEAPRSSEPEFEEEATDE
jgi:GNAT superfamily N-acetyltransferase